MPSPREGNDLISPTTTRLLLFLGGLVGSVGAVLVIVLSAAQGLELLHYFSSAEDPTWGEVGFSPFIILLQTLVAVWVLWSVFRHDPRPLLRNLLLAFGGSFVLAYGWYYLLLLLGGDGGGWVGVSNLLYLVAALFIAVGRLAGVGTPIGNDRVRSR